MTSPVSPRCSSDPELQKVGISDFVSTRKRKQRPDMEEWEALRTDLNKMFNKLSADQEIKFKQMNDTIKELSDQNKNIILTNKILEETLNKNIKLNEDLKKSIQLISTEQQETIVRIEYLEEQLENIQRQKLSSTLEINNLPKTDKEDLFDVINKIHISLGLTVEKEEVTKAYRIVASKNNTVLIQYKHDSVRNDVLKAVKNYNKKNVGKGFNTKNVDTNWNDGILYFSESLTQRARHILYAARNFKKTFNYKYCWTAKGKIFLKKLEGFPAIQVKSVEQINILSKNESKQ